MRLELTRKHLDELGLQYNFYELKGLGRIDLVKVRIVEHYIRPGRINIYADNINLMNEVQLIGWINHNEDRFPRK